LAYFKKLVGYLGSRVEDWSTEFQEMVDTSPGFDFLELKPIFHQP
jgi:hypothetical protein